MEKRFIDNETYQACKEFLNVKDLEYVAEAVNYSVSTVHNIVNKMTKVNKETQKVVDQINAALRSRITEVKDHCETQLERLKKIM